MPQANRRINTSVFQPFGSDRVELRVGEQSMAVSQLEALNLLRRLAHHFGVEVPANAVVRAVESQREPVLIDTDEFGEPRGIAPAVALAEVRRRKAVGL